MRYISTRGEAPALGFIDVTLAGLARDGGLYVPDAWPVLSPAQIAGFAGATYAEVAFAILKPFVSEANLWMVQNHGIFQGYNFFHYIGLNRDMRDMFVNHPHYERTAEFIELYDNRAFNPAIEILPISEFEPMVRRLMAKPKNSIYKPAIDAKAAKS